MKFLNKLERKYGRYAIHGLMRYIIMINIAGAVIGIIAPQFYFQYLSLNFGQILRGQIWRLVTFIFYPGITGGSFINPINMIFFAVELYLYYMIGNSLENAWGAFRFNLYYISGILLSILSSVILYIAFDVSFPMGLDNINQALFLAFAVLYPNVQLLLFFVIPIKVKWLGILYGALLGYQALSYLMMGQIPYALALLVGVGNFLLFFFMTRNYRKISPREQYRKANFRRQMRPAAGVTRHKCAVCGRTEEDDETLEFRFCSRCEGNYEYCMEHLFTHEHVKKH